MRIHTFVAFAAALLTPGLGAAYPGGTPNFQTDVAPFCAACHSSRDESALAGAGERATKNFFERFGLVARAIVVHRPLDDAPDT